MGWVARYTSWDGLGNEKLGTGARTTERSVCQPGLRNILVEQSVDFNSRNVHHENEFQEIAMSIVIEDPRLEQLAKQLAASEGTTVENVFVTV